MAANTDKARKGYYGPPTTLAGPISDTATTIPLSSTSDMPTDTAVDIVVDRVDANGTETPDKVETMTVVISGNNGTNAVRGVEDTAKPHAAGAVVEILLTAATHNDLVDMVTADHEQNGHHKTLKDANGNELIEFPTAVTNAANHIKVTNAVTGGKPLIEAAGSDTNVSASIKGKGTGKVDVDGLPPQVFATEAMFDFVASGCVWSGDNYASTRNASMTAGVVYIGGKRLTVAAVNARTFTASKDTYIDLRDNGDGTATIIYTEVANNAASPALTSGDMRIGIIVTAAGSIGSAGSVNQGQENKILPISSSIPYAVTDSLGNLICPRDPMRRILGKRQILTTFSTSSTSWGAVTGLTCPVQVPTGRKIRVSTSCYIQNNTSGAYSFLGIFDGSVSDANRITSNAFNVGSGQSGTEVKDVFTPTSTSKTYITGVKSTSGTLSNFSGAAPGTGSEGGPMYILVELV